MKKIGICLLAIGVDHINESLFLIDKLKNNDNIEFYISTNSIESFDGISNIKIIKINENFNFNLKRISVEVALNECDIILIMDTDILILDSKFDITSRINRLREIEDGVYSKIVKSFKLDLNDKYHKTIFEYTNFNSELYHLHEHLIIIKTNNINTKKLFIDNWNILNEKTFDFQHTVNGLKGATEGLIIHASSYMSGLNFTELSKNSITNEFSKICYHYSNVKDKFSILNKDKNKLI